MAVKSVDVRNAQKCLVVKSAQWASSRTATGVLSANAERQLLLLCLQLKQALACQWMGADMKMRRVGTMDAGNVTVTMDGKCVP